MLGIRREIDEECVILYINMTGETLQTREKTGKNFEILSGNRADAAPLPADKGTYAAIQVEAEGYIILKVHL